MKKITLILSLFFVSNISFAGEVSGKFTLGLASLKHELTSCATPCYSGLLDDSSSATMGLGFFYNTRILDVGINTLYNNGLGYAVDLRKRLGKFNISLGVGQIETKADADFGTFNPYKHSADAMGNMGYIDLSYHLNSNFFVFGKYLYTTADHSEKANEFLGFDVDGIPTFGPNTRKAEFESKTKSLSVGAGWLF